ncbi:3-isopropylmalate dehydratase [Candidatus Bipolaricaulota bacterium]|nr:3-isopropylmalate dehydratase [Candidatus Bipolaricaulota bacterium]
MNTDYIIPGKYLMKITDDDKLAEHAMEGVDTNFRDKAEPGDFIVAGHNFGSGSSREEAPTVIKHSDVGAVLAKSFARIFYRNAVNIGLPIIECDTDKIDQGDELYVDLEEGNLNNLDKEKEIELSPLPPEMNKILDDGGLVSHLDKHGTFNL